MIKSIEWSDDYNIGNNTLDIHHKLFFEMVRDLSIRIEEGKRDVDATEIVEFLQEYIAMHFAVEEEIMREAGFPDIKNHQAIHNEFSKSIQRLHDELHRDEVSDILDKILDLTQSWFLDHILVQDKQLVTYFH